MIYLDNAATSKMDERCNKIIEQYNREEYYNTASPYSNELNNKVDKARSTFIKLLNGERNARFIFTPSATISNNIAILGSTAKKQKTMVFAEGEHSSVDSAANFLKSGGYNIKFAPLNKSGSLDMLKLEKLLDGNVGFVSVMLASNETGAIDDIKKISELIKIKCPDAILHIDAVQGFCKIPINLKEWGVQLCTVTAHKIHGPKGIAGLYIAPNVNLKPIFFGGGQEYNLCPGTLNTGGIMAFEFIAEIMHSTMQTNQAFIQKLRDRFIKNLSEIKNYIEVNGDGLPDIISLSIDGTKGAVLVNMLKEQGVLIATGSACVDVKAENRALTSMGQSKCKVVGSVRVSLSHLNTMQEIDKAAEIFVNSVKKLLNL